MKAQFNAIKSSNQSIKIDFQLIKSPKSIKNIQDFFYNKELIFKYSVLTKDSKILISIIYDDKLSSFFHKTFIGAFIFDYALKFNALKIDIICEDKLLLNHVVYGFNQKDFIYSIHKKNSLIKKYKCNV